MYFVVQMPTSPIPVGKARSAFYADKLGAFKRPSVVKYSFRLSEDGSLVYVQKNIADPWRQDYVLVRKYVTHCNCW